MLNGATEMDHQVSSESEGFRRFLFEFDVQIDKIAFRFDDERCIEKSKVVTLVRKILNLICSARIQGHDVVQSLLVCRV